jgi:hypothetical protein
MQELWEKEPRSNKYNAAATAACACSCTAARRRQERRRPYLRRRVAPQHAAELGGPVRQLEVRYQMSTLVTGIAEANPGVDLPRLSVMGAK